MGYFVEEGDVTGPRFAWTRFNLALFGSGGEAFLHEEGELVELAEAVAFFEDAVTILSHAEEEGVVDFVHHAGGEEGFVVFRGEEGGGLIVVFLGALGLEFHVGGEAVVVDAVDEVLLGVLEAVELAEGEVDAVSVGEVFADVPEDVGELEGVAEGDGVVFCAVFIGSEEGEADEADGGGDAEGVLLEVFPGVEALGMEVHLAALDDVGEVFAGDLVAVADGEDIALEVDEAEGGVGLVGGEDVFPAFEAGGFLGEGEVEIVSEVIDDAAVGVEGDEVVTAVAGNAAEGKGEV